MSLGNDPARVPREPGKTLNQQIEGDHAYAAFDPAAAEWERTQEAVSHSEDAELAEWVERLEDQLEDQRREVMSEKRDLYEAEQQLEDVQDELEMVRAELDRREL